MATDSSLRLGLTDDSLPARMFWRDSQHWDYPGDHFEPGNLTAFDQLFNRLASTFKPNLNRSRLRRVIKKKRRTDGSRDSKWLTLFYKNIVEQITIAIAQENFKHIAQTTALAFYEMDQDFYTSFKPAHKDQKAFEKILSPWWRARYDIVVLCLRLQNEAKFLKDQLAEETDRTDTDRMAINYRGAFCTQNYNMLRSVLDESMITSRQGETVTYQIFEPLQPKSRGNRAGKRQVSKSITTSARMGQETSEKVSIGQEKPQVFAEGRVLAVPDKSPEVHVSPDSHIELQINAQKRKHFDEGESSQSQPQPPPKKVKAETHLTTRANGQDKSGKHDKELVKAAQLTKQDIGMQAPTACRRCKNGSCLVARDPLTFKSLKCQKCLRQKQSCTFDLENPGRPISPEAGQYFKEQEEKKKRRKHSASVSASESSSVPTAAKCAQQFTSMETGGGFIEK
ncbi:hypothetical protein JX266_005313 [Neoarthrinium moseri]|nr:hypothetical protein JX266_005313 [Neoarthrinium moseri]